MAAPEIHYAQRADGVNIAYQELGSGPPSLVFCWGWISHLDLQWTNPDLAQFFRRLARFCRVVIYDKPGTGLSDPITHVATLEERVEDVRLVLDAAGLDHAAVLGESEAGPVAALFAATYPERTDALIIWGSLATGQPDDAELAQFGGQPGEMDRLVERLRDSIDNWGEGRSADWIMPSMVSPFVRRGMGTFERSAVSPSMARALIGGLLEIDLRDALGAISAPTLVLHRSGDVVPIAHGRLLASRIPGARIIELPGSDHAIWTQEADTIVGEIEQLLTGARTASPDRMLATILFTDIVDSTRRAAEQGDAAWRALVERHNELAGEAVSQHEGRLIKSLGDGILAVFTGPARAISCARDLIDGAAELGLHVRAGVHTGECEALGEDVAGMAVNIGARVAALAGPAEILVSKTVVDLLIGSGIEFAPRGDHELKGVPGRWQLYSVSGQADRPAIEPASQYMTTADRAAVRLARRAPGLMRGLARLSQRGAG